MRPSRFRHVALIAIVGLIAALAAAPAALADPPGTCPMGTPFDGDLAVSVDGVDQAHPVDGVFGPYAVSLCRDVAVGASGTDTYSFSVGRVSPGGDQADLVAADLDRTFSLSFTPQAGDTPLTAEVKGRAESFAIDALAANRVTLTAKPIAFATINGCPTAPAQCIVDHPSANAYHDANLSGAVRYMTADGAGAAGFDDLPGLTTSSGAFMYFVWASCPTNPMSDQTYNGLRIDLGGPHFLPDGTTPNTTSVSAFIPAPALLACFGVTPRAYAANALVTRTEAGATAAAATTGGDSGLVYEITADDSGVTIGVPAVTFSKPRYAFGVARVSRRIAVLARRAGVAKPKGGSLKVVVASRKVCIASVTTLYGFKRGTCRYTVKAMSKRGRVVATERGTLRVT